MQLSSLLSVIDDPKYVIIFRKVENEGTILKHFNVYVNWILGGGGGGGGAIASPPPPEEPALYGTPFWTKMSSFHRSDITLPQ